MEEFRPEAPPFSSARTPEAISKREGFLNSYRQAEEELKESLAKLKNPQPPPFTRKEK